MMCWAAQRLGRLAEIFGVYHMTLVYHAYVYVGVPTPALAKTARSKLRMVSVGLRKSKHKLCKVMV